MKDSILIEGREFISVGRAAEITKYTNDYVGQLCRAGKVAARMIGRTWFVDRESLTTYKNSIENPTAQAVKEQAIKALEKPVSNLYPKSSLVSTQTTEKALEMKYVPDTRPLLPELKNVQPPLPLTVQPKISVRVPTKLPRKYIPDTRTALLTAAFLLVAIAGVCAAILPMGTLSTLSHTTAGIASQLERQFDFGDSERTLTASVSDIWSGVGCAVTSIFFGGGNSWCSVSGSSAFVIVPPVATKVPVKQVSQATSTPPVIPIAQTIPVVPVTTQPKSTVIIERPVYQIDDSLTQRVTTLEAEILADRIHNQFQTDRIYDNIGQALGRISGGSGGTVDLSNISGSTITNSSFSGSTGIFSSNVSVGGTFTGAGLTDCSGSSAKLVWSGGTFSCGVDAGGTGTGISALGAEYSAAQMGATQTLATSSDTNLRLTITSTGDKHTFTPSWVGTLASGRGGTGISSVAANQLLVGNAGGTGWTQVATSSLGLSTTDVVEGSNLYFTNARARSAISESITGLDYTSGTGDFSLTSGYSIPLTASTTDWNTAYINRIITANLPLSISNNTISLSTAGNWTGTFDGQEGSYYLNAANLTGFGTPFYQFFSATTTDALAQGSTNRYYSDTLVNNYIHASTTIPKIYTTNTFTGNQTFNGANIFGGAATFNSTLTVGSLTGPLQAIAGVVSATSTIASVYGGTGFSTYTAGDILYADSSGRLARLPISSDGLVLKLNGGLPSWQSDLTSGGGGGFSAWSTTTGSLAIYPSDTTDVLIIGSNATTSTGNIFEVAGNSKFGGNVSLTGSLSVGSLTGPLQAVGGTVSASSTMSIVYGGTGTSTAPAYGQILVGDSLGRYTLTSTSSLGITSGVPYTGATADVDLGTHLLSAGSMHAQSFGPTDGDSSWTLQSGDGGTFFGSSGDTFFDAVSTRISVDNDMLISNYDGATPGGIGKFTIENFQTVGVGTTTPWAKFSLSAGTQSTRPLFVVASTTNATLFDILGNGNIGIGTTSPWRTLSVNGSSDLGTNALAGSFTATSTSIASIFPYASTTALTVSGTGGFQLASALNGVLQAVNGLVSASSTLSIAYGGTGTSTAPTYGQLLLGNALGGYTLTATSSLGITTSQWATSGSNIYYNTGNVGIGSTSPTYRLSVEGTSSLGNAAIAGYFTATSTTATSTLPILRAGEIRIVRADGSWTMISATTSSDIGRGTALLTAMSRASVGDSIYLSQGTFDIGSGTLDLSKGNPAESVSIHGAGKYATVVTGSAAIIVKTGSNSDTTDLSIIASAAGAYRIPWGLNSGSTDLTNARIKNVYIRGYEDGLYINANNLENLVVEDVTVDTSWDAIVIFSGNNPGTATIKNSQFNVAIDGNLFSPRRALNASSPSGDGLTINVYDSRFISDQDAIYADDYTDVYMYGGLATGGLSEVGTNSTIHVSPTTTFDPMNTSGSIAYIQPSVIAYNLANYTGNVGIGTTSPYAKLSVDGRGVFNQDIRANYFTATSTSIASIFPYASTTALTVSGTSGLQLASGLNGPLQAVSGVVSASSTLSIAYGGTGTSTAPAYGQLLLGNVNGGYTLTATSSLGLAFSSLTGTASVSQGGTGATSFGQGWIYSNGGTGALSASTSPTINYLVSTSTSATSTFAFDVSVAGELKVARSNGSVSVGTLNTAAATNAIAIGRSNSISSGSTGTALAFGVSNSITGNTAIAFGHSNTSSNNEAEAIGRFNTASGNTAVAIGYSNTASNTGSIGIGSANNVSGSVSSAFGYNNTVTADGASVFGTSITNGTANSTMIGPSDAAKLTIRSDGSVLIATSTAGTNAMLTLAGGNFVHTAVGNPTLKGVYDTAGSARDVYVSGKYAYVADNTGDLRIIDISDPSAPVLLATQSLNGFAYGVYVSGKYAYVTSIATNGLYIVDVSNPTSPILVGTYVTPDLAYDVYVSGKYAYVADAGSGLLVIDVSNPTAPVLAGSYNTVGTSEGVYVSGKYAYVADTSGDLQIIDISNPASPAFIKEYDTPGLAFGVYVSGRYAYLANHSEGLTIVDISNPTSPSTVGTYATGGLAYGVYVSGKYAYVIDDTTGLNVINVSSPASPFLVGTYATAPGISNLSVYVSGKYAYVADGASGLLVVDINGIDTPTLSTGNIETGVLNATDNIVAGGDIYAGGGLNVGISGIFSRGTISSFVSSTTQTNPVAANFMGGNVGIGTTTPYAALSVLGQVVGSYFTATTTATSTFAGNIQANLLNITSTTATSTFANGINLSAGCFSVSGVCLSNNTYGDTNVNSYIHASTTIPKTYTANVFTALQTFQNASSTIFSSTYASSTNLFAGSATLGSLAINSLNGPLQAVSGTVSASSSLSIAYGGTGTTTAPTYGQILVGNTLGKYTLTATSSLGITSSQWTTSGSNIYYNTGNVGVNNASPSYKLDVNGDIGNSVGDLTIRAGASTGNDYNLNLRANDGDNASIFLDSSNGISVTGGGTGGGNMSFTQVNGNIDFTTNASDGTGDILFVPAAGHSVGIGTSSPWRTLSVTGSSDLGNNALAGFFTATTTATSTFAGNIQTNLITVTSTTATSTFANGINLSAGCFSIAGVCLVNNTYGDTNVNAYIHASTTIPKTYTANTFTGAQTFSGGLTIGSLTGPLQALNGVVSASSSLSVAYGGTGATSFGQGWIYSNGGTGALSASTSPTVNYITATSTATSTFAGGATFATGAGSFGIGSSSPSTKFVVAGGTSTMESILPSMAGGTNNVSLFSLGNSTNRWNSAWFSTLNIGTSTWSINNGTNGRFSIFDAASGGGNERFSITTAGNVGIGTTSPYAKLSVAGQIVGEYFTATSTTATSTFYGAVVVATTSSQTNDLSSAKTLTAWGDSLTYGLNVTSDKAWPSVINRYLNTPFTQVNNYGITSEHSTTIKNRMASSTERWGDFTVIWMGTNDLLYSESPTTLINNITAMVNMLDNPKHYVILPPTGQSTDVGNAAYTTLVSTNNSIAAAFPNNYIDIRAYLISQYDSGIPQDVTDHANDVIPSSLRSDTIHMNEAGYRLVAQRIAQFINAQPAANEVLTFNSGDSIAKLGKNYSNITSSSTLANWFAGFSSGNPWTTGTYNYGIGSEAALTLSTGSNNVFFGRQALGQLTTGSNNVAIGYLSQFYNTTNSNNISLGQSSLYHYISDGGIGIGQNAGGDMRTGPLVAIGNFSFRNLTSGTSGGLVGLGTNTGYYSQTGSDNTFIGNYVGYQAGSTTATSLISGSQNTFLGAYSGSASNVSNASTFGYNATSTLSNSVVLGDYRVTRGGIGTSTPSAMWSVPGDIFFTATSTGMNGLNLTAGCFSINGTCLSSGSGSGTVNSGTTGQFAYYAGAGTAVTGTSSVFVATNQRIGIGTTTPSGKLHVAVSSASDVPLVLEGVNSQSGDYLSIFSTSTNKVVSVAPTSIRTGVSGATLKLGGVLNFPNSISGIGTDIDELNGGNTALYITPPQNGERIFIGTAAKSPYQLDLSHVSGGIAGLASLSVNRLRLAGDNSEFNSASAGTGVRYNGYYGFEIQGSDGGATGATTAINNWGDSAFGVKAGTSNGVAQIIYQRTSGTGDLLQFKDSSFNKTSVFNKDGWLGVASSTPWRTLSVNGTVALNGLTSSATGNAVCITTSKDITDAGGASCTPSSARFKENISPLSSGFALDTLSKLTVVGFDYKEKQPFETNHSYGMIAEDVANVDNNLVDYGYDGQPLSLHFEKITGLLVQAVQEQQHQIGEIASTTTGLSDWKLDIGNDIATTLASSTQTSETLAAALDSTNSHIVQVDSTLADLQAQMTALASSTAAQAGVASQDDINIRISEISTTISASSTFLTAVASSTADLVASSTAERLATSTSFITRIADAVKSMIETAGEWALNKITAHIVYTDRVEAQVAAISNGLEMTDASTHQIYCVQIANGDWSKKLGSCSSAATTTEAIIQQTTIVPPAAPVVVTPSTGASQGSTTPTIEPVTSTIPTSTPPVVDQIPTSNPVPAAPDPVAPAPSSVDSAPSTDPAPVVTTPESTQTPAP